jgi:hypothetical protein
MRMSPLVQLHVADALRVQQSSRHSSSVYTYTIAFFKWCPPSTVFPAASTSAV